MSLQNKKALAVQLRDFHTMYKQTAYAKSYRTAALPSSRRLISNDA